MECFQGPFGTVWKALLKTSVMMTGEFDFDGIFNSSESEVLYPAVSYGLFMVFIVIMAILLTNLLVSRIDRCSGWTGCCCEMDDDFGMCLALAFYLIFAFISWI